MSLIPAASYELPIPPSLTTGCTRTRNLMLPRGGGVATFRQLTVQSLHDSLVVNPEQAVWTSAFDGLARMVASGRYAVPAQRR